MRTGSWEGRIALPPPGTEIWVGLVPLAESKVTVWLAPGADVSLRAEEDATGRDPLEEAEPEVDSACAWIGLRQNNPPRATALVIKMDIMMAHNLLANFIQFPLTLMIIEIPYLKTDQRARRISLSYLLSLLTIIHKHTR